MGVRAGRSADPAGGLGDILDLLAALLAASVIVFVWLGASGVPRVLLALGFTVFVPGRAIVTNWPRMASWSEAAMPVVFSLALLILVTTVTLWVHYWHPLGLAQVLAALSLGGLTVGVLRRHRRKDQRSAGREELKG
jgi:hypothetical protein